MNAFYELGVSPDFGSTGQAGSHRLVLRRGFATYRHVRRGPEEVQRRELLGLRRPSSVLARDQRIRTSPVKSFGEFLKRILSGLFQGFSDGFRDTRRNGVGDAGAERFISPPISESAEAVTNKGEWFRQPGQVPRKTARLHGEPV